jgi:predicted nucleotidyltransferase component of viral defense system
LSEKEYFDSLSSATDFNMGPLEKAHRLLTLVREIYANPRLERKLALKGGTAIQFVYMGVKRLSVDVDLNYVGSVEKDAMENERLEIRGILDRLFRSHGYRFDGPSVMYLEEQFELKYRTASESGDKLKVEINYGERLPVMELKKVKLEHPFPRFGDIHGFSYCYEEIMAQKLRALLSRGTARDLFDIYLFANGERRYDASLFKKLFVFYSVLDKGDARNLTDEKVRALTKQDIKRWLAPMLRCKDHGIDLEAMRVPVLGFVKEMLDFDEDERRFMNRFYDERQFDQGLLFGDIAIKNDLSKHPMVQWRLRGTK